MAKTDWRVLFERVNALAIGQFDNQWDAIVSAAKTELAQTTGLQNLSPKEFAILCLGLFLGARYMKYIKGRF